MFGLVAAGGGFFSTGGLGLAIVGGGCGLFSTGGLGLETGGDGRRFS